MISFCLADHFGKISSYSDMPATEHSFDPRFEVKYNFVATNLIPKYSIKIIWTVLKYVN